MKKPLLSKIVFFLTLFFLFMPLVVLVVYSFNDARGMNWSGFSIRWYIRLFSGSTALWNAMTNSVIIAFTSGLTATVLGTLGSIGLVMYQFKLKGTIQSISFMPLILPEIIMGVSLLVFFSSLRIPLGMVTIYLAHVSLTLPFVLLMVQARLEEFDVSIIEAAKDLGAKEWQILVKILLPIASPGIAAGFLTAVTLSLEDFVVTFFVAGPGSTTLPIYLFSVIKRTVPPEIRPLSVVLIVFTIFLAWSGRKLTKYLVRA